MKMTILYRVCDVVGAYNGKRLFGNKLDIIKKSTTSLTDAIRYVNKQFEVYTHVVFDKTTTDTKKFVYDTFATTGQPVYTHDTSDNAGDGNMKSFKVSYEIAKQIDDGLLFFLEDDYILNEKCLVEMFSLYNSFRPEQHVCMKPHHDMYTFVRDIIKPDGTLEPRELMFGHAVYWFRDITSTCTFCIDRFVLEKCDDLFQKTFLLNRVDEQYLNQIYTRFPLFSPIPSLGEHLQNQMSVSPFFGGRTFDIKGKYQTHKM